jgi:hypothetical protein
MIQMRIPSDSAEVVVPESGVAFVVDPSVVFDFRVAFVVGPSVVDLVFVDVAFTVSLLSSMFFG